MARTGQWAKSCRAGDRISNEHKNSSKEPKNRLNEIFACLSQPLSFDPEPFHPILLNLLH